MAPDSFSFCEAILQVADANARHPDLEELFLQLTRRFRRVAPVDVAGFCMHDPLKNVMRVHIWEGGNAPGLPPELPMDDSTAGWVWQNQIPLTIADVGKETRFEACLDILRNMGVRSFCELPMTATRRRLGTIAVGSSHAGAYGDIQLRQLLPLTELVAMATENAMTREALYQEKVRLQMLLEVNATLVSSLNLRELFPAISQFMRRVIRHDFAGLELYDEKLHCMRVYALDFPAAKGLIAPEMTFPLKDGVCGETFLARETRVLRERELAALPDSVCANLVRESGARALCCLPLMNGQRILGTMTLGGNDETLFRPQDLTLLKQVAGQLAAAMDNACAYHEIEQLKERLAQEKIYLQGEIHSELDFGEIIGESKALRRVLEKAKTVAGSDATVLVLGETGTGKELMARAIHRMSLRKDASFIKMNCAAIPTGLLESELFGHEKGAFTGAIMRKVGRLELADKGTLFLDEIGDISLELQPKLLRVLQDQEFERLGSTHTLKVNIRLIAATNRDLAEGVAAREFRSDLYYRLNVFPIVMPPLRDRTDDIPLLVRYFVQKFAKRSDKVIEIIPTETMDALKRWEWPGNVRELENFMERSVILSPGHVLNVPLSELISVTGRSENRNSLEGLEREHILRVLREAGGVVAGIKGAAARLGLKRTTLQSRMQRLGIIREEYEN